MINIIKNRISNYREKQEELSNEFIAIRQFICNKKDELIKYINELSLEDSEDFMNNYSVFMDDETKKTINSLVDKKKDKARFLPQLNKLKDKGFSVEKIVKLDEFMKGYFTPLYPGASIPKTFSLRASGLYSILSEADKKILAQFIYDENIGTPVITYRCDKCDCDDCDSSFNITSADIDKYKEYLTLKKLCEENYNEEYQDKLDKLENEIKIQYIYCNNKINIQEIINRYENSNIVDITAFQICGLLS